MEEWKVYRLDDLTVDGKGHYGIGAPAVEYDENKYTYLRITDINDDGSINYLGLKSVDDPDASRYLLKDGDIVFARTGNSTGRSYYYEPSDGQFVFAGFLIKFSLDSTKVNPRFLKYYTHSKPYYEWVQSFDTGATRGNINAQTYGAMEIKLPSRDIQDRLVEVLSSLDEKIKLNKHISHNLDEQAQALFKNWFVDYEPFQEERFVESDLGNIPEGWEVRSLSSVASYLNGLAMQKYRPKEGETGIPVLKIKELGQGHCDSSSDLCSPSIKDDYIINDGDVIFSWSGTLLVDIWCGGSCGLNQHLFKVSSNVYPKWFYYLWTRHYLNKFIAIARDKAVTMGHIKRDELDKALVCVPNDDDFKKADMLFSPIIDGVIHSRIENKRLSTMRDALLPKLISGEIAV